MAAPYTSVTVSSYNANPPPDDGSESAANRVLWATHKTKLGDPLKTAIEAVNTNVSAAFGKVIGGNGVTVASISYEFSASDQGKLIRATTGGITITTADAAAVGSPFVVSLVNDATTSITLDGNGSQTVNGVASITIPPGNGVQIFTDGTNWFTDGQNFTKAFPPPSAFKNLSIKVASNTTVTVSADFVSTTDGASYQTTALNSTINLGTNGAVNALDTGTIAAATWYAIHAVVKADGTTGAIASLSATAPTMPSGYTYKARLGWVRTAAGVAQLLGSWQLGREVQYVLGLAQTTIVPICASGSAGTYSETTATSWSSTSVSSLVPTTASHINLTAVNFYNNGTQSAVQIAPNSSYQGHASTKPPPFDNKNASINGAVSFRMMLESSNIFYAANAAGGAALCTGWTDNI